MKHRFGLCQPDRYVDDQQPMTGERKEASVEDVTTKKKRRGHRPAMVPMPDEMWQDIARVQDAQERITGERPAVAAVCRTAIRSYLQMVTAGLS